MITTLTLNPALDKTLIVENLIINKVNRVKSSKIDAGGKGINVSKVIKALGEKTIAMGVVGGRVGQKLEILLNELQISYDFVHVDEDTRTNTKLVDMVNGTCTDINEVGPKVDQEKLNELLEKIIQHSSHSEMLVLSGNCQPSVPNTIYKDIMELLNNKIKVVLDASGGLLKEGLKGSPWLVKPNVEELSEILGRELNEPSEILEESRKIISNGTKYVCVSLGADGLILVSESEAYHAKPPKIFAKSTVGAGDSVVGSLSVSLLLKESMDVAIRKACAISAASVTLEGTGVPPQNLIEEFYTKVIVEKL